MTRIPSRWKLTILLVIVGGLLFDRPDAGINAEELVARGTILAASKTDSQRLPALKRRRHRRWSFQETTTASKAAVRKGNKFLLTAKNRDGGYGNDIGQPSDVGISSFVGLAFMAQGNTLTEGPRNRELRQIVTYVVKHVRKMSRGADVSGKTRTQLQSEFGYYAPSFFAALFLSQVVGETANDHEARRSLVKLIDTISRAQQSDGSWGQDSYVPTLGTVMGWVCLRGSYSAGFEVQGSANKTAEHLMNQMDGARDSRNWMQMLYRDAAGIRVLYAMGKKYEPVTRKAVENALNLIKHDNRAFAQAGGEDYLAHFLITDTMLQSGGEDWKRWYPLVRDRTVGVQNSDGSWTGHHCMTSRVFCTAAAVLILSAPNRMLPISQE
ncbi:MAG: hypothetical protein IID44_01800 [Planctomycetes bacterium]|nr:hypothetical protein [Planctomycetota bacterium]